MTRKACSLFLVLSLLFSCVPLAEGSGVLPVAGFGGSLQLPSNTTVGLKTSSPIILGSSNFTIETWLYFSSNGFVFELGDGVQNAGQVSLKLTSGTGSVSGMIGVSEEWSLYLKTRTWVHLVWVYNDGLHTVYINGNQEMAIKGNNLQAPFQVVPKIANQSNGGYVQVDELRIWSVVLDSPTIKGWMNRPVTEAHPNFNQSVSYWSFNESSAVPSTLVYPYECPEDGKVKIFLHGYDQLDRSLSAVDQSVSQGVTLRHLGGDIFEYDNKIGKLSVGSKIEVGYKVDINGLRSANTAKIQIMITPPTEEEVLDTPAEEPPTHGDDSDDATVPPDEGVAPDGPDDDSQDAPGQPEPGEELDTPNDNDDNPSDENGDDTTEPPHDDGEPDSDEQPEPDQAEPTDEQGEETGANPDLDEEVVAEPVPTPPWAWWPPVDQPEPQPAPRPQPLPEPVEDVGDVMDEEVGNGEGSELEVEAPTEQGPSEDEKVEPVEPEVPQETERQPKPTQPLSLQVALKQTTAIVNGNTVTVDVAPYMQPTAQRVMMPVRFLSDLLGLTVHWNGTTREVLLVGAGQEVRLTIGSSVAIVDGQAMRLDAPAEIKSGRTFIPLRFVAEALGAKVHWDQLTGTVTVSR